MRDRRIPHDRAQWTAWALHVLPTIEMKREGVAMNWRRSDGREGTARGSTRAKASTSETTENATRKPIVREAAMEVSEGRKSCICAERFSP